MRIQLAIAILISLPAVAVAQAPVSTVWDGTYTDPQADRGKAAYETSCIACHKPDLEGIEDALKGARFFDKRREDNLESFFLDLKRMPLRNPGSLPDQTYIDIMTYVLRENAFPAGTQELTMQALPGVQVLGKEGPAPLPGNFPVLVVGCLSLGPNDTWRVMNATEPIRTRRPFDRVDGELRSAYTTVLGTLNFRLQNVEYFNPEPWTGHKIQAKGTLVRAPAGDRIIVNFLESLAPACEFETKEPL